MRRLEILHLALDGIVLVTRIRRWCWRASNGEATRCNAAAQVAGALTASSQRLCDCDKHSTHTAIHPGERQKQEDGARLTSETGWGWTNWTVQSETSTRIQNSHCHTESCISHDAVAHA